MKKVAVIMGSDSDFPVMKNAVKSLKDMGIPVEVHVLSAHRTPKEAGEFASAARENGFGVMDRRSWKSGSFGWRFGRAHDFAGDRCADEGVGVRWDRRAAGYRSDAKRSAGCYGCH